MAGIRNSWGGGGRYEALSLPGASLRGPVPGAEAPMVSKCTPGDPRGTTEAGGIGGTADTRGLRHWTV